MNSIEIRHTTTGERYFVGTRELSEEGAPGNLLHGIHVLLVDR